MRAWQFALGAVIALSRPQLQRLPAPAGLLLAGAGTPGLLLAALLINASTPFPGWWTLLPTGAAALISAGLLPSSGRLIQWFSTPWLRWIGDRSYALYLWHWPAVVFMRLLLPDLPAGALLATLLAVLPAMLSYRMIEHPLRHAAAANLLPAAGRILAASAATIAVSTFVASAASAYRQPLIAARDPDRVAAQQRPLTLLGGCQPSVVTTDTVPCRWNADATGRPLYLLGDSNAGHHAPGLIAAATQLGRPLSALAAGNCLVVQLETGAILRESHRKRCAASTAIALAWLDQQPAGTVLISQSDRNLISGLNTLPAAARAGATAQLRQALLDSVRHLQAAGHHVYLVQTVRHFFDQFSWDESRCPLADFLQCTCTAEAPLAALQQRQAPLRALLADIAATTGSGSVDFGPLICPDGICRTADQRGIVYRDAGHISNRFSATPAADWISILANS